MKNKLLGLVALASCVMLASCGPDPVDPVDPVDPTPVDPVTPTYDPIIEIAPLPSEILIGDEIDLAKYITVSGGKGTLYSVNIADEDYGKVTWKPNSDTVVVAKGEGSVSFTVSDEGATKNGSFTIASEIVSQIKHDFADVGYNYGIYLYNDDDNYADEFTNYGENYFASLDINEEIIYGFMSYAEDGNGELYYFESDGEEFSYQVGANFNDSISDYSYPLPFGAEDGELSSVEMAYTDGSTETLVGFDIKEDSVLDKVCYDWFGYNPDSLKEAGYELTRLFLLPEDEQVYGALLFVYGEFEAIEGGDSYVGEEYVGWVDLDVSESVSFSDFIVEELAKGEKPVSIDYSQSVERIQAATSSHNYQVNFSATWNNVDKKGEFVPVTGNPCLAENASGYPSDFLNAFGECGSAIITPTQSYVSLPSGGEGGVVLHDDHIFEYKKIDDKYVAYEIPGETSLYGFDYGINFGFLEDEATFENFFINSQKVEENDEGSVILSTLSGLSGNALLNKLLVSSVDPFLPEISEEYETGDNAYFEQYSDIGNIIKTFATDFRIDVNDYFEIEITEKVAKSGNLESIKFDFIWEDVNLENTAYVYYVITAEVIFESAEIPEKVAISDYNYYEE